MGKISDLAGSPSQFSSRCLLESVPPSILLAACCPFFSSHYLPGPVFEFHPSDHQLTSIHVPGQAGPQSTASCSCFSCGKGIDLSDYVVSGAYSPGTFWPLTPGQACKGKEEAWTSTYTLCFKSPAPNTTWGRSVQIPSQFQPTSTTLSLPVSPLPWFGSE